jgi:hypothetical protein
MYSCASESGLILQNVKLCKVDEMKLCLTEPAAFGSWCRWLRMEAFVLAMI